ncbi:S-layer homology domain-containing protein [Anaerosphaera multitolerans]|uniref:SLH domain-containing protein n=1 Tax=Anaerosphaera multitolerans TaxID=2487351 RepID=A0A437S902_9FIRM|nr:S-layer homology domain-containing protein [Anaerosphaera multitolerans]RVU55583.1 hypothetical protein EF514_02310 [Anaerosphaera multitolerans]
MKNNKRWLSLLLVFVMMLSVMPLNVFAANETEATNNTQTPVTNSEAEAGKTDATDNTQKPVLPPAPPQEPVVIKSVTVTPKIANVDIGKSTTFTATVDGDDTNSVTWDVDGSTSNLTTITNGVLKVGENETGKTLTVTATSVKDSTKSDTATVTVTKPIVINSVTISPKTTSVVKGGSTTFTVTVDGDDTNSVTWDVDGSTSKLTTITNGVLKVGENETGKTLTVTATSAKDSTKSDTATVTVRDIVVTVSPATATMKPNESKAFTAKINGVISNEVEWSVVGGTSNLTKYANGKLTIGNNETAKIIRLIATSTENPLDKGEAVITVQTEPTGEAPSISKTSYTFDKADKSNVNITTKLGSGDLAAKEITKVTKDGNTLSSSKVTIDGRYVTLKSSYLEDLSNGTHYFKIHFDDKAKTAIEISVYVKNDVKDTLKITDAYRSGDYIKGKVNVGGATVRFYRDGSSSSYASDVADSRGYFEIRIGSISTSRNDYVRATKYGYSDSDKYYLSSSSGNGSTDDKRVYPEKIRVTDGGYRVEGRLPNYKNTRVYVEYDGRSVGDGMTDSSGYFDIKTDSRVYDDSGLKFYVRSSSSSSSDKRVYPTGIDVYDGGYRVKGRLSDYKNTRVYVEYDGRSVGNGMTDSSGYFDIKTSSRVYDDSGLKFYVRTSDKTKAATITSAKAGEYKIEGTAADYAKVTIKDSNNVTIGSATADKNGKFTVYANRTLKAGEKLTITTSESGKSDNTITYTVTGVKEGDLKRIAYIKGYPNGNFKPHGDMTRAEAATMFARLLNNSDNFGTTKTTKFTDASNQWYSEAINYVVNKGLISGYPDGTFKPNNKITRAEFAQMISGYITVGGSATNFNDVKDHWAKEAIEKLYGNQSIKGYPDGTFKPNDLITRAEAVTILNSVFGRVSDTQSFENVKSSLKSFNDVKSSDWFYANVMDASNAHESYRKSTTDDTEIWTKIN